jgi:hypothetical protein
MATSVNFNRKIPDSREFEFRALGHIKDQVFPYTTIGAVRSGGLSAHYLEASTKGDTSKLAVLFNTGPFVDIAYFVVGGIYGYGGFIPTENLQSITISDRVTGGFYELDVVIAGETLRRPEIRTLRGWAIAVLNETGAIRECETHGWMQDRADPHARGQAFEIARRIPPRGVSPEVAVAAISEVLDGIGDTCPECPADV